MHSGRCVSRCPPGYYGKAIAQDAAVFQSLYNTNVKEIEESYCAACGDTNCYECVGGAAN